MESREIVVIFILVVLAVGFAWLFQNGNLENGYEGEVCFEKNCFEVEIADDALERQRGLMYRESLEDDGGMLFVFEELGIYPFWMKDTFISLDMIWISGDGGVVFIAENVQPCVEGEFCESVVPSEKALYVLELNAGKVEEIELDVGESVEINL